MDRWIDRGVERVKQNKYKPNIFTQDGGQEFVVSYVLDLSSQNFSGFLKRFFFFMSELLLYRRLEYKVILCTYSVQQTLHTRPLRLPGTMFPHPSGGLQFLAGRQF